MAKREEWTLRRALRAVLAVVAFTSGGLVAWIVGNLLGIYVFIDAAVAIVLRSVLIAVVVMFIAWRLTRSRAHWSTVEVAAWSLVGYLANPATWSGMVFWAQSVGDHGPLTLAVDGISWVGLAALAAWVAWRWVPTAGAFDGRTRHAV